MNKELLEKAKKAGCKVIAHRGADKEKENQLDCLVGCFEKGFDIVETDVHLTKDEQVVISHDPDLKRIFRADKKICDCTLLELREVADENRLPTLNDLLSKLKKDNEIHIELKEKNQALYLETIKLIKQYSLENSVRVIGFKEYAKESFRKFNGDRINKGIIKRFPAKLSKTLKEQEVSAIGIGWSKNYQFTVFKSLAKIANLKKEIGLSKKNNKIVTIGTPSTVAQFEFALSLKPTEILTNYIE